MDEPRKPGILSPETEILKEILRGLKVDETIGWDDLKRRRGIDYQNKHYHCVSTAKRHLAVEKVYIDTVRGKGLVRVGPAEAVGMARSLGIRIARAQRRKAKFEASIDTDDLENQEDRETLEAERIRTVFGITISKAPVKKLRLATDAPGMYSLLSQESGQRIG